MSFFHPDLFTLFFWLVVGHCLADYPLQGDFLANAKNPDSDLGKLFWKHALFAHSMIQAGFVLLFTGSVHLAIAEALIHAWTDYGKCKKYISLNQDQLIHIVCKLIWVFAIYIHLA